MNNKTPFLPNFPHQLQGSRKRSQQQRFEDERTDALRHSISDFELLFDPILPVEKVKAASNEKRSRTYCEFIVFWAWVAQILGLNQACDYAVSLVQSWRQEAGLPVPSSDNSSFCNARKKLGTPFLKTILSLIEDFAGRRVQQHHLWHGHTVKALDGTSFRLMDTTQNQEKYPQPSRQKPGCGFPVMGALGVLNLSQGTMDRWELGRHTDHDSKLAQRLVQQEGCFKKGDVVLGDRAFNGYATVAQLLELGAHSVMRLNQSRAGKLDWRRGKRISPNERIVIWEKPLCYRKSSPYSREQFEAMRGEIEMRYIRLQQRNEHGGKETIYIATTLLDTVQYPADDVIDLHRRRWEIEVRFRDIKTTLGMEQINVRCPKMAEKSIYLLQIVFNLIKTLQLLAVEGRVDSQSGEPLAIEQLGFKATVDAITAHRPRYRGRGGHIHRCRELFDELIGLIASKILQLRPGRSEPRVIKLRPKPYPKMSIPRSKSPVLKRASNRRKIA